MLLTPGFLLAGKYQIVRLAERGGMALLYEVRHKELNLPLALKILMATQESDPLQTAYFQSEARALAQLRHPSVPSIVDLGSLEGHPYLIMEWLEGETLLARLRRLHRLPLGEVLRICEQIGQVLIAAHSRGIVHRDLKPGNIFLCQRPELPEVVKVLDFGVARVPAASGVERPATAHGTILGTPEFMSPEQARGDMTAIGPQTDQYALAMLAYAMLRGQPAFVPRDASPEAVFQHLAVVQTEPPPPLGEHVGTTVTACLMQALSKRPEDRFASVQVFLQTFADAQKRDAEAPTRGGGSTVVTSPSAGPQPPPPPTLPPVEPSVAGRRSSSMRRQLLLLAAGLCVGTVFGHTAWGLFSAAPVPKAMVDSTPVARSNQALPQPDLAPLWDLAMDLNQGSVARAPVDPSNLPRPPEPPPPAATRVVPPPPPPTIEGVGLALAGRQVFADAVMESRVCKPGRKLTLRQEGDWLKVQVPWPQGLTFLQAETFLRLAKQRWLELPVAQTLPAILSIACPAQ